MEQRKIEIEGTNKAGTTKNPVKKRRTIEKIMKV
jgi:hypothetical protein